MSRLYIAIHNWVINVQHFKTKGGFPPPRNFSVRTHVNFTPVKRNRGYVWKATRKRKSWTSLNSYVYAWPFIHCLYFIYVRKIYQRSQGKITRQWKSTLTDLINREGMVVYCVRAVGRSVVSLPASWSLHRRQCRIAKTDCVFNLILFADKLYSISELFVYLCFESRRRNTSCFLLTRSQPQFDVNTLRRKSDFWFKYTNVWLTGHSQDRNRIFAHCPMGLAPFLNTWCFQISIQREWKKRATYWPVLSLSLSLFYFNYC